MLRNVYEIVSGGANYNLHIDLVRCLLEANITNPIAPAIINIEVGNSGTAFVPTISIVCVL